MRRANPVRSVIAAGIMLAIAAVARAQPAPPPLTGAVNDFAHVIDESSAREIEERILALKAKTGDVVVVATVPTFQPYADIDEYAVKMFENGGRGIGERGKDNGVLILAAVNDRKLRIEVGYDLEQFITDGYAGETIRTVITPRFRDGQYGAGLLAGATRIIDRIAEGRGVTLREGPRDTEDQRPVRGFPIPPIVFIVIALLIIGRLRRRRHRRYWGRGPWSGWNSGVGPFGGIGGFGGGFGGFGGGGGGGRGGGFGGFGGGRSGGGGASGGW
jgi:uncharacterized protein